MKVVFEVVLGMYDISDMFFIAACLANLSDIPVETTMRQYPTKLDSQYP